MDDMCRLRHVHFKIESQLIGGGGGGVRFPFFHPLPNSLGLHNRPLHLHARLKLVTGEANLRFPVKQNISVLAKTMLCLTELRFLPFPELY
jgi:hypothetical protein